MVAANGFIGPALPPHWQTPLASEQTETEQSLSPDLRKALPGLTNLEMEFSTQVLGHGLNNLGNSCFLAATVQCLTHLAPLACLSLRGSHRRHCASSKDAFCAACALHDRITLALTNPRAHGPRKMYTNLQRFAPQFQGGQQEDAHEFLLCCLDAVERDSLELFKCLNGRPFKPGQEPRTEVSEVFGGVTCSRITCLSCGAVSDKLDPFYDLSLDLHDCHSVCDALERFTEVDRLEGSNLYCCEKCKRKVEAEKRVTVQESPNALVIHLKRFSHSYAKITRQIDFDEVLDLGPFLSRDAPELADLKWASFHPSNHEHANGHFSNGTAPGLRYFLSGVIVHRGWSAHHGHYYAYVRPHRYGPWHLFDDSIRTRATWPEVASDHAYVLFYCRERQRGTPPPPSTPSGSPRWSPTTPSGATPTPKRSWESQGSLHSVQPTAKRQCSLGQSAEGSLQPHGAESASMLPQDPAGASLAPAAPQQAGEAPPEPEPPAPGTTDGSSDDAHLRLVPQGDSPAANAHAAAGRHHAGNTASEATSPPSPSENATQLVHDSPRGVDSTAKQQQQPLGDAMPREKTAAPGPGQGPALQASKWLSASPRSPAPVKSVPTANKPVSFTLRPKGLIQRMEANGPPLADPSSSLGLTSSQHTAAALKVDGKGSSSPAEPTGRSRGLLGHNTIPTNHVGRFKTASKRNFVSLGGPGSSRGAIIQQRSLQSQSANGRHPYHSRY